MSGEKDTCVRLRSSERDRLMRNCRRVDDLEQATLESLRQQGRMARLQRDLAERTAAAERRSQAHQQRISQLNDDMRRIETTYNRRLADQARQFQQGIDALGDEMRGQRREYLQLIEQQEQRLRSDMADQRRDLEQQIGNLRQEWANREASQQSQAQQWLDDTRSLLDLLGREYRHQKFKPGALERLQAELQLAQGNIDQGNHQAAIAAAQQSYLRGQDLRQELERLELEWSAYLSGAQRSAAEALALCQAQTTCRFMLDTEDGAEEVAGEVDHWTEGALTDLMTQVQGELTRLDAPQDLTLDQLKASIRQCEGWQQDCHQLTERAKQALIASQLRHDMALTIEAALAGAGWQVTDSTYEGEDQRRALHVKLQNLGGDEMVTVIHPEADPDGIRNRLNLSFFDYSSNDEGYRQQRLRTITETLRQEDLEVGQPQCVPGTERQAAGDQTRLDFQRVRQTRARQAGPTPGTKSGSTS